MSKYEMKLQPLYYNFIINGSKRIEIRLNDEKRSLLEIGDIIKFRKLPNLDEFFYVKVTQLFKYSSFSKLVDDFDISILANKSISKEELLDALEQFYPLEEQEKYGALGIEFEIFK